MVGGSRSSRCSTCKQRKIKCDLQSPTCGQCQRANRFCAGPVQGDPFRNSTATHPTGGVVMDTNKALSLSPQIRDQRETRLIFDLNEALQMDLKYPDRLPTLGLLIVKISPFLGRSEALDTILECFLFSRRLLHNAQHDPDRELGLYGRSVRTLRRELLQSCTPETLAAALLLCQYETVRPDLGRSFIVLSEGVSAFFQAAGPSCLEAPLNQIVLRTHIPPAVTASLFTGRECFLILDEWHEVVRSLETSSHELYLWLMLMRTPRVVNKIRSGATDDQTASKALVFRQKLEDVRSQLGLLAPLSMDQINPRRKELWVFWSCIILSEAWFARLGLYTDYLDLQTRQAVSSLIELMVRAGSDMPSGATLAGPIAYAVALVEERAIVLQAMQKLTPLSDRFKPKYMLQWFEALAGGCWLGD